MTQHRPLPNKAQPTASSHITLLNIAILHEPGNGNASAQAMVTFIQEIRELIVSIVPVQKPATLPSGCGLILQFRIPRTNQNGFKLALSSSEAVKAFPTTALYDAVDKHPIPMGFVHLDYVEFQVRFSCWGFEWGETRIPRSL
jgi:hypothetical protein